MRDETVARSYAETLFELAQRHDGLEAYREGLDLVTGLLNESPQFRLFLDTPRIAASRKKEVLRSALNGRIPPHLLNFVLVTIDKRRQRLLPDMGREFHGLLDEHLNRAHVDVTVAQSLDDEAVERVGARLSTLLGKTAIPHFRVRPEIIGGIIVRTGDTVYDGSLGRRLEGMRHKLLATELHASE